MHSNRARDLRKQTGRGRIAAFEPLGTRIALSAGGITPFAFETSATQRPFDAAVEYSRELSSGGEFAMLQRNAWQRAGGEVASGVDVPGSVATHRVEGPRASDGPGWRQQEIFVGASDFNRPAIVSNWGSQNHRMAETLVAPTSVQVAGTSLFLPGLLVSRGDAITLVVSTSPIYGLPIGSQSYFRIDGREPLTSDRNGSPKPLAELAVQQAASSSENRNNDHSAGTISASPGPNGSFTLPPRASDRAAVFSTMEPRVADARVSSGWVAGVNTEVDGEIESIPAEAAPVPGQWAISRTELDEGLIELESPLAPRRKGRRLPGESVEVAEEQQDNWADLEALAGQVWSAWNEAWREFGREVKEPGEAANAAHDHPARFNADVNDGLVELVVENSAPIDVLPRGAHEQLAESSIPVRIDAGVAIYQEFEIATAAEAIPPVTARNAERKAKNDERAEAEKSAEGQPISAAAVGAGLIIALPFSLRRRRQDEDELQQPMLRRRTT